METVFMEDGYFYHIYNRGNNRELIFIEPTNYGYFLRLIKKYITPVADIYAYCLLGNHFHLLIKGKRNAISIEQHFSNLFNAYAKAFNKMYNRSGKLFSERFKKKKIIDEQYLTAIIYYIHSNPQKHELIADFRKYKYSSYKAMLSTAETGLQRAEVLEWFGGRELFKEYHNDEYLRLHEHLTFQD